METIITSAFLKDNATAHLGNAIVCVIARLLVSPLLTPVEYLQLLPPFALAIFAFAYVFEIANQVISEEEDVINKPSRPIPAGLLTKAEASQRWILSWSLLPTALCVVSGLQAGGYLIIWQVWIALHYAWPRFNHWVMCNTFTAVGVTIQLNLLDTVITHAAPAVQEVAFLNLALFLWFALTVHVQEFPDIDGDRENGRRTLPLILSPKAVNCLRAGTGLFLIVEALIGLAVGIMMLCPDHRLIKIGLGILHLVFATIVATRLVVSSSREMDKMTYQCYYFLATYSMVLFYAQVAPLNRSWS
ncbi:hypothetical protein N7495_008294 [Penicillium taxi]|uniref:uncharacterized protein n=1 Tax=Penicillium taxi TaxID=168475 RepID=UPI0025450233|nr:uncharacterized protein N7495_008294 [Penicillium taxi]KAJ5888253.1 hypothetical protein N7495_008294 [Penicillium taxi]